MDKRVRAMLDAARRGDWESVRQILHPYAHWTSGETRIRGRTKVLAYLADHPTPAEPNSYELRDGQIYRWTDQPD